MHICYLWISKWINLDYFCAMFSANIENIEAVSGRGCRAWCLLAAAAHSCFFKFIFHSRRLDHRNQYTDNIQCTQTLFLEKLQTELNPLIHTTLHTVERLQASRDSRLIWTTTRGITGTSYYDLISFQTLHHRWDPAWYVIKYL